MKYKEILDKLEEIEGQLDDYYYSLPEYDANSEGRSSLDGARNDLYNLKDDIERTILDENKIKKSENQAWLSRYLFVRSSNNER